MFPRSSSSSFTSVAAIACAVTLWACSPPPTGPAPSDPAAPDAGSKPQPIGPRASVSPSASVHLGQAPFFEGAVTAAPVRRTLSIINTGDAPLLIQKIALADDAMNAATGELDFALPPEWRPGAELAPKAGSNLLKVDLWLAPKALGSRAWTLTITSNDPTQPELHVRISAEIVAPPPCELSVTPAHYVLTGLSPPEYRDLTVTVRNEGTAGVQECRISEIRVEADPESPIALWDGPIAERILRASEAFEIPIRITPTGSAVTPISYEAKLRFKVSSPTRPAVTVPIRVDVMPGPCLTIAPDELDFGTLLSSCEETKTVTIYNTCGQDVVISSVSLVNSIVPPGVGSCTGSAPCPEFELSGPPPIPPGGQVVLEAGAPPISMRIRYHPRNVGADIGALTVVTGSGSSEATYLVSLHGKGYATGTHSDIYYQEKQPTADLLLVIDNSPSMANWQTSIASNLGALFQYVENSGVDFRIAAITADTSVGAAFLTGPGHPDAVLTPTSANLASQFAAKVNVGTTGTGSPRCLKQAVDALSSPLINGPNASFLRANAALSVLCITDVGDNSANPVGDYVNDLWALKPTSKTMVNFNAVSGFTPACPCDNGRLADAVAQTNGTSENICVPDWHKTFEGVSKAAFGPRSTFYLTARPDLQAGPITVTIDGAPVPAPNASGSTVWTYDPVANAVTFEPMFIPAGGQTIVITYSVGCWP